MSDISLDGIVWSDCNCCMHFKAFPSLLGFIKCNEDDRINGEEKTSGNYHYLLWKPFLRYQFLWVSQCRTEASFIALQKRSSSRILLKFDLTPVSYAFYGYAVLSMISILIQRYSRGGSVLQSAIHQEKSISIFTSRRVETRFHLLFTGFYLSGAS